MKTEDGEQEGNLLVAHFFLLANFHFFFLQKWLESITGSENYVSSGIAATLQFLKERGGVNKQDRVVYIGRQNDFKQANQEPTKPDSSEKEQDFDFSDIRLEYVDEKGRKLTPKEAFRQQSYIFHGKKPGKNKIEKRHKRYVEQLKSKTMSSIDTPLQSASKMKQQQEKLQSPFLVLDSKTNTLYASKRKKNCAVY